MLRLFYCDHHSFPLPPGHRFPTQKYALLRGLLEKDNCRDVHYQFEAAEPVDAAVLEYAHDSEYVRGFLTGTLDPRVMRRIGFPWSEGLVRRTLASVGGTLSAAHEAGRCGFGGNLAGGTHHAFRDEGSGFCVFNDIAVAIQALGQRAAVIDLDVHQGDGTASIFEGNRNVLTFSMHAENNFPFHKQRSAIDIGLTDGASDFEYLEQLRPALARVAEFRPEVIYYQSGVDGLAGDRLGRLKLTHEGLMERDRAVFQFARTAGIPIVVTLGGGYADPIERTAEAHANTFRVAAALF